MGLLEIIDLLINAGADIDSRNTWGVTPLIDTVNYHQTQALEKILNAGANPNFVTCVNGNSALHIAIRKNYPDIVEILLKGGCRQDVFNSQFESPAHYPVAHNQTDMVRHLLVNNYDFDIPAKKRWDSWSVSLFYLACDLGHMKMACLMKQLTCATLTSLDMQTIPADHIRRADSKFCTGLNLVSKLQDHCRKAIRKSFGLRLCEENLKSVALPKALKHDVLFKDFIKNEPEIRVL